MLHALDRYQAGRSPIHQLDPQVKLVVTLLFILSNLALPDAAWPGFALALALLVLLGQLTGLGPAFALRRSFVALPFALAAVTVIFTLPGRPLLTLPLGGWSLTASDAGLARFASIVLRSWLSVQMAILLTATTAFPDLMRGLRALGVPALLVAIVSFMYRYLFVLVDEAGRLLRAREARSAARPGQRGGGGLLWRARVAGSMAGQLFLRSYERSDRVYGAMLARGYSGRPLALGHQRLRPRDWAYGAAAVGALVLCQLAGWAPHLLALARPL